MNFRKNNINLPAGEVMMKKVFSLCMSVILSFFALESYGQNSGLDVSIVNKPLEQALRQVEAQSDFLFFYNIDEIDKNMRITVEKHDSNINEILDAIVAGKGLTYTVKDRHVVLKRAPVASSVRQGVTLTGRVTDENGDPLPGATIHIQGTTGGTITDANGDFSIQVLPENILEVSFVGYGNFVVAVGEQKRLEIRLTPVDTELEEVVVVGYGTQRKVSVIASITTIEPAKLKTGTTRSLSNNLVGNLGGIIGVQRSGEPGYDNSEFWIRGISTFGGGSRTPLVLIDGIERSLNDIDIQEVESISVLKDASASAVYGVRGSNGVILITTKRGKIGKPVVNIQVEHAVTAPVQLPEFLNSADYLTLLNDINLQQHGQYLRSPELIEKYRTGYDPELYPDVNWMNAITKDYASNTRTTLDINGGTELLRYSFIAAYYHESGIIERDDAQEWNSDLRLNRFNMRTNVDLNVTKTTLLRFNIGGYLQNRVAPPQSIDNLFAGAFETPPYVHPTRYVSGELPKRQLRDNPWARATQTGYARNTYAKIESVFTVEQDISFVTGLKARGIFSFDNYSETSVTRSKNPEYYNPATERDPETGKLSLTVQEYGQEFLGHSAGSSYGNNSMYLEGSLLYDRSFGKHLVNGLLLYNQRSYDNGDKLPYRNQGFAGRAAYTYDRRYIAEVNFGYNGSENFAEGQRFGFFPSVAAGWLLSEEPFMASVHDVFSKVKFRVSHGLAGNDNLGGRRFAYITTIGAGDGYTWGTSDATYYRAGRWEGEIGVSALTWETVAKTNFGVEVELYKSVELQVDVFKEKRRDIFMQRNNFPSSAGFVSTPWANYGKVDNQGFETTLIVNKQINSDWAVAARVTTTYAVNKITEQDESIGVRGTTRSGTGKPINQLFGFVDDGLFTADDFADLSAGTLKQGIPAHVFSDRVYPGDVKYVDVYKDGVINDLDKTAIGGTTDPQFVYGFAASVNYKRLDFAFLFQGNALTDRIIGRGNAFIPGAQSGATGNIYTNAWDAWTVENPRQDAFYPRLHIGHNPNNSQESTWWLKDMSMLRMKNIELGYSFPQTWTDRASIRHARIYLRGANLLCFSKFKLWDPELSTPDNNGLGYPMMRSVSVGLDVTFK
ncbi:MAG: TonB-dependent receptor [Bacteroidales bacterium]|jgi:TonB-linked SusC/RagA family outer membrane protein|nr:TonB-dependent receptor [Bacteroidales bacterium]